MKLAVVIPLFNGGAWISETLNSVYSQRQKPYEVVVVDDGSTDDALDLISTHFPSVLRLKNIGKGSSLARNIGIENTCSPYLAFLDQDDLWHPNHLRNLSSMLDDNPNVDCAVASAHCFSDHMPLYSKTPQNIELFDPWTNFPFTMGVEGPSVALFRRDFLMKTGLWQAEGTGMGDILLFLKVSAKGPILRTSAVTVGKRVHSQQQWLHVRADPVAYMRRRVAVTQLALNFRKTVNPAISINKVFERRWSALQVLTTLAEIECNGNLAEVPAIAMSLEKLLDAQVCRHAFYCLMGALFPIHDVNRLRELRDRSFERLLKVWPSSASMTRTVLASLIGEQPIVS
jgi:glycosyltransferase involved in cell wall biosynthesis